MPALLAPRYWANHLLLVVLLVAAAWLGLWQYDGWQARRDAEARDLTQVAPIPLADAIGPDDPFPGDLVGQPVEVQGSWVNGTYKVSGREHEGRDGYWVVGVVQVGDSLLPVVRGWEATPSVAEREPQPFGATDLVGWLQPSEGKLATDDDPTDNVLPQLRVADLAQSFDEDLYGAYVVVSDGTNAGNEGPGARRPPGAPGRRPVHRDPQPALRDRVVVLRGVRGVRVVALGARHRGRPAGRGGSRRAGAGGRAPAHWVGSRTVSRLFHTYRVLALVVGVLLAFCSLVALPLKYLATEGSDLQQFGEAPASCGSCTAGCSWSTSW